MDLYSPSSSFSSFFQKKKKSENEYFLDFVYYLRGSSRKGA